MSLRLTGLTLALLLVFFALACQKSDNDTPPISSEDVFEEGYNLLSTHYIRQERLNALTGQFDNLGDLCEALDDPYTYYLDTEEWAEWIDHIAVNRASIGFHYTLEEWYDQIGPENPMVVTAIVIGSRAYWDGVLVGDQITAVNGTPLTGHYTSEISSIFPGDEDSPALLDILRSGNEIQIATFADNVFSLELASDYAYISVRTFTQNAAELMASEIISVRSNLSADNFVFDFRGNPGGSLNAAIQISHIFVPEADSTLTTIAKRFETTHVNQDSHTLVDYMDGEDIFNKDNTVILQNNNSASASEIVTACAQDYEKAYVMGQNSYGKGVGMSAFQLSDASGLVITSFLWYTPNNVNLDTWADPPITITPDWSVELDPNNTTDSQVTAAFAYLSGITPTHKPQTIPILPPATIDYKALWLHKL